MAHEFLRYLFSEPSELTLGLRGLEATALPMSCVPFSGVLSAINFGDITVEIVRGTPLLLFETVPEGRLGLQADTRRRRRGKLGRAGRSAGAT